MATATTNLAPNFGLINKKPDRVILTANPGLDNAEALTVLLNPKTLSYGIDVEWSHLPVVGLDYEVIHYSRTKSIQVPMSFYFSIFEQARQQVGGTPDPSAQLQAAVSSGAVSTSALQKASMDFVNFLESLAFPTRIGLRPPTVKVYWPNVMSMYCVLDRVRFEFAKFDRSLAPIAYQADVTWLEARVERRYSEDVRDNGLIDKNDPDAPQGI
jgi:hypothetical protein